MAIVMDMVIIMVMVGIMVIVLMHTYVRPKIRAELYGSSILFAYLIEKLLLPVSIEMDFGIPVY